jgi:hypothetical protein
LIPVFRAGATLSRGKKNFKSNFVIIYFQKKYKNIFILKKILKIDPCGKKILPPISKIWLCPRRYPTFLVQL